MLANVGIGLIAFGFAWMLVIGKAVGALIILSGVYLIHRQLEWDAVSEKKAKRRNPSRKTKQYVFYNTNWK